MTIPATYLELPVEGETIDGIFILFKSGSVKMGVRPLKPGATVYISQDLSSSESVQLVFDGDSPFASTFKVGENHSIKSDAQGIYKFRLSVDPSGVFPYQIQVMANGKDQLAYLYNESKKLKVIQKYQRKEGQTKVNILFVKECTLELIVVEVTDMNGNVLEELLIRDQQGCGVWKVPCQGNAVERFLLKALLPNQRASQDPSQMKTQLEAIGGEEGDLEIDPPG